MRPLMDLGELDGVADDVLSHVKAGRGVKIVAPTGAGRASLADLLAKRIGDAVSVHLPPFESLEAPLHGLLQAAAARDKETVSRACDHTVPFVERAQFVAQRLADDARVVIVLVPESWSRTVPRGATRLRREEAATNLLEAFLAAQSLRVVMLASERSTSLFREGASDRLKAMLLPPSRVSLAALRDESEWGSYGPHVRRVCQALDERNTSLSPLQARLLVGAVALGADPDELLPDVEAAGANLAPLANRLVSLLRLPQHAALAVGVRRVLRARFPIPKPMALALAAVPTEHAPFVTACVGYGGETIRFPDAVRSILLIADRRRDSADDAHLRLAEHHRKLDGEAAAPASSRVLHWLEKAHHYGHAGKEGQTAWEGLKLAGKEQIFDRAWSLSVEHHDFKGAAALYEKCIKEFDSKDAYAWHYLGYNLARSRAVKQVARAELAFRRAIELESDNPWWNGRLVTFLIRRTRYAAADEEWRQAIKRVDPLGDRVWRTPWLARQFHRWPTEQWLAQGEVARANRVFASVPSTIVDQDELMRGLRERLEDAAEAVVLGTSVYPRDVPMARRWIRPRVLPSHHPETGAARREWFPGRAIAASGKSVTIAVAHPKDRRVIIKEVAAEEWPLIAWCPPGDARDQFLELGVYGLNTILVLPVPTSDDGAPENDEEDEWRNTAPPV